MDEIDELLRQIMGGIILIVVFVLLAFASGFSGATVGFFLLIAVIGLMLVMPRSSNIPADGVGIQIVIPDGEYVFGGYSEELKNSRGEDFLEENRSKIVQVWRKGEENFFGKAISWRAYRSNDPERDLENIALVPGLVLRIKNNVIEKVVLYEPD